MNTSNTSKHLTKRNNKILQALQALPPNICNSEETPPPRHRHTRHTLAQLRTNKSPFLKSYLHKIDVHKHASPLGHFNCKHKRCTQCCHPGFVDKLRGDGRAAGKMERQYGRRTNHRTIGSPPCYRKWWVDNNNNNASNMPK